MSRARYLTRVARSLGRQARVLKSNKRFVLVAFGSTFDLGPKAAWPNAEGKLLAAAKIFHRYAAEDAAAVMGNFMRFKMNETSFFDLIFPMQDAASKQKKLTDSVAADARLAVIKRENRLIDERAKAQHTKALRLLTTPYDPAVTYPLPVFSDSISFIEAIDRMMPR